MALCKTGTFTIAGGIYPSIRKHLQFFNLQPVKRMTFTFDPFGINSSRIRQLINLLNRKNVLQTNPYCKYQTNIVCDRREPTVEISLVNGETILLKCSKLDVLDIIKIYNEHVSVLAPKEEAVQETIGRQKPAKKGQN